MLHCTFSQLLASLLLPPLIAVALPAQNPAALSWSTLLGGTATESPAIHGMTTMPGGQVLVWGQTSSVNFPIVGAVQPQYGGGSSDGFVAMLDPNVSGSGQLIWSTYFGGSGSDGIRGACMVSNTDIVVCGWTDSANFPVTPGCLQPSPGGGADMFVSQLAWTGSALTLVWSTHLGAAGNEAAEAVTQDGNGSLIVAGSTSSATLPMAGPSYQPNFAGLMDGVVARIDGAGSTLIASTFLGGAGTDSVSRLAIAPGGLVVLAGTTNSFAFPTSLGAVQPNLSGATDGFVCQLSSGLDQLVYSTYLGGAGTESMQGLALTPNGILVGGWTSAVTGTQFPTTTGPTYAGGIWDGFLTIIDPTASGPAQLGWSRLYGGSGDDGVSDVAWQLDLPSGRAIAVGVTSSPNLPTTGGAFQPSLPGGTYDGFLASFEPGLWSGHELVHGSYLGAAGRDEVFALALVGPLVGDEVLVAGVTTSTAMPTTASAYASVLQGPSDVFVARLAMPVEVPGSIQSVPSNCGLSLTCVGTPLIGHSVQCSFRTMMQPLAAWIAIDLGSGVAWNGLPLPQSLQAILPVSATCQQVVAADIVQPVAIVADCWYDPWSGTWFCQYVGTWDLLIPYSTGLVGWSLGAQAILAAGSGAVLVSDGVRVTIGKP